MELNEIAKEIQRKFTTEVEIPECFDKIYEI